MDLYLCRMLCIIPSFPSHSLFFDSFSHICSFFFLISLWSAPFLFSSPVLSLFTLSLFLSWCFILRHAAYADFRLNWEKDLGAQLTCLCWLIGTVFFPGWPQKPSILSCGRLRCQLHPCDNSNCNISSQELHISKDDHIYLPGWAAPLYHHKSIFGMLGQNYSYVTSTTFFPLTVQSQSKCKATACWLRLGVSNSNYLGATCQE